MAQTPFAAARTMFALVAAAMKLPSAQLTAIGPYRSRGHGEGFPGNKHSRHTVAQDRRSAAKTRRQAKAKSRIYR